MWVVIIKSAIDVAGFLTALLAKQDSKIPSRLPISRIELQHGAQRSLGRGREPFAGTARRVLRTRGSRPLAVTPGKQGFGGLRFHPRCFFYFVAPVLLAPFADAHSERSLRASSIAISWAR